MAYEPIGDITTMRGTGPDAGGHLTAPAAWLDPIAIAEAPVAICTVDLDGRIRAWNPAAEQLLGWTAAEVIGRKVPFLAEDDLERVSDEAEVLWRIGHLGNVEFSPVCRDGSRRHAIASASVLRDPDGSPTGALVLLTDVTGPREATRALEASERKWRHMLDNISDTVIVLDTDGRVRETSGRFEEASGYAAGDLAGTDGFDLVHPDDRERAIEAFSAVLADPEGEHAEVIRTRHADGHYEHIEYTAVNLLDEPTIGGIVLTGRNVTQVKASEALMAGEVLILELIAKDAPLTDTLTALAHMVEDHTRAHVAVLFVEDEDGPLRLGGTGEGFPRALAELAQQVPVDWLRRQYAAHPDLLLRPVPDLAGIDPEPEIADHRDQLLDQGIGAVHVVPVADRRSEALYGIVVWYHDRPHRHSAHEEKVAAVSAHLAAIAIDRARAQHELEHAAWHDELTGLPNRNAVMARLERSLAATRDDGTTSAAMFVDIDRFKVVNDSLGHSAADRLLARVARRIANVAPPGALVGHFAADEFVIVLDDVDGIGDPLLVAERIDSALSEPFSLPDGEVYLSASVGIALSDDAHTAEVLLQHADTALTRAKRLGRSRVEVFDTDLRAEALARLHRERDLRLAVDRGDLVLHFQPKVAVGSERIVGAEALLRWEHPEEGRIPPTEFIPIAEENGLIRRIGAWVLEESVRHARAWVDELPAHERFVISVNLSARQLSSPELLDDVARVLEVHRWPPDQLMLELTETVLIDDTETSLEALAALKRLGVKLAIDDFGTGYSSLNYLHRFPVDVVKIDRAFVIDLDAAGEGSPVAAAVMHVARALGLTTCAEGVEEGHQLDGLRALGCQWAQGFLFAEPLPADEMADALARDGGR